MLDDCCHVHRWIPGYGKKFLDQGNNMYVRTGDLTAQQWGNLFREKSVNQAIMIPLNAEVAVLPRPASTNNLNNATAFNARIEALGDRFMDEMFIQSNLDVEEVSRLLNAGFVSKEVYGTERKT